MRGTYGERVDEVSMSRERRVVKIVWRTYEGSVTDARRTYKGRIVQVGTLVSITYTPISHSHIHRHKQMRYIQEIRKT